MIVRCPGSKGMRHPVPEMVACPSCGREVEIWSDEISIQCRYCNHTVSRTERPTCFDWCKMARECAGEEVYTRYKKNRAMTLKQKLQKGYADDEVDREAVQEHIDLLLGYAEKIVEQENGDWHIVIPACIINEMNFHRPGKEVENDETSLLLNRRIDMIRSLLLSNNFSVEDANEICDIINCCNSSCEISNLNFDILHDSIELAATKIGNQNKKRGKNECSDLLDLLHTATGRKLVEEICQ